MFNLKRRNGKSKCSLEFTDFLLFLRFLAQVSRLSNVKPKYWTTVVIGIMLLLNETEGKSLVLCERVIY